MRKLRSKFGELTALQKVTTYSVQNIGKRALTNGQRPPRVKT